MTLVENCTFTKSNIVAKVDNIKIIRDYVPPKTKNQKPKRYSDYAVQDKDQMCKTFKYCLV